MPQRLNPDKTYHQISVGPNRVLWRDFIFYAGSEATSLCELVSNAMAVYPPFLAWKADRTLRASRLTGSKLRTGFKRPSRGAA